MRKVRVGFIGFGEVNSPPELIHKKCGEARKRLTDTGEIEVAVCAQVSDVPDGSEAKAAGEALAGAELDLVVLCIAGWIPSHAVIDSVLRQMHLPMVLWGLCGEMNGGRLVTTADQAGTSALRKVMEDMGFKFKYVYETIGGPERTDRVLSYCIAARAAKMLRGSRAGMMGYRDMKLYGTLIDASRLKGVIGAEIENFEMLEMTQRGEKVPQDEIAALKAKVLGEWKFLSPPKDELIERCCRYYLALREKILDRKYDAVSLIDVDGMKKLLDLPPSMIFMLITNELGVSAVPENDEPGLVTQLAVRYLTGQIATYIEFYEFMSDRVLAGVPDFVPAEATDGEITVRPVGFGGFAESVLNVSKLKTGRVTMYRLTTGKKGYAMHIVTGEAVAPRPWEEAGWAPPAPQLPGLEIIPDCGVEAFAEKVFSQHYIVAYGDCMQEMVDLCGMLGIEVIL